MPNSGKLAPCSALAPVQRASSFARASKDTLGPKLGFDWLLELVVIAASLPISPESCFLLEVCSSL